MRIVQKVNCALVGVIAVSAVLNFAALQFTVMPSFSALEQNAAERNQARVLEAIDLQKSQAANSAGDYAIWDDTYAFMLGNGPDYEEKNLTPESLKTLGVDYFVAVDTEGKIVLDKGFDFSGDEPAPIHLFAKDRLPPARFVTSDSSEIDIGSSLMHSDHGLVAVGYSPILLSDRSGERRGTLILGKLLDVDALKSSTKVEFDILPPGFEVPDASNTLDKATQLEGIDGKPIATVVSHTATDITKVGQRTIWTTLLFLLAAAALVIAGLGYALRKIAVTRIERMRQHLLAVASSGDLNPMPRDGHGDELSETKESFNFMVAQLADMRELLRRQDYDHGAADQAAGTLHNVRNALSPISALCWSLARNPTPISKEHLGAAVREVTDPDAAAERKEKLSQFLNLSIDRMFAADETRRADLETMLVMMQHVDEILKEQDKLSQLDRPVETVALHASVNTSAKAIRRNAAITLAVNLDQAVAVRGHKIALEQVLANIFINAAEAIEAKSEPRGSVLVTARALRLGLDEAVEIIVEDDGIGIAADDLQKIFEKGYSTKEAATGGLGLHWSANAINAMSGRIFATSAGIGQGAAIHIILPGAQPDHKEAA